MKTLIHIFELENAALLAMDEEGSAWLSPATGDTVINTPIEDGQWSLLEAPEFTRHKVFDSKTQESPFAGFAESLRSHQVGAKVLYGEKKDKTAQYGGVQWANLEGYDPFEAYHAQLNHDKITHSIQPSDGPKTPPFQ